MRLGVAWRAPPRQAGLGEQASLTPAEQRPLIVAYFADCDPSGWQMGISVLRKLQALSVLLGRWTGLEFEVHRVALTPDQVRGLSLPSTPLKDTGHDPWSPASGATRAVPGPAGFRAYGDEDGSPEGGDGDER
jgi:hypothetical protein